VRKRNRCNWAKSQEVAFSECDPGASWGGVPLSEKLVSRDLADLLGLFGTARAREDAGPSLSHPIYFERPDAVDLDDVALRYGKVMHALGHDKVGARWHIFAGFFVKLVTSSDAEDP
jgi:hypothetical protein